MKTKAVLRALMLGGLTWVGSGTANAAIVLPNGDNFLNGTIEFKWASNGSARIDPALYIGGNADFPIGLDTVFLPPGEVTAGTGLDFGYSVSGVGTGTARVTYRIGNNTGTEWRNLRFIGDVSGDIFDAQMELASVKGAGGGAGNPARFGIDDFHKGDLFLNDVQSKGELDNANHCLGACESEGALQWNLDALGQGKVWEIDVLLSELGVTQSQLWLEFELTDTVGAVLDPRQVLTYSGSAVVVPLPPSLLMFGAALLSFRLAPRGQRRRLI